MKIQDLVIDPIAHRVSHRGKELRLTPREYGVLLYLARRAGQLVRSDELLQAVWGSDAVIGDEALRTALKRLRRKLGDDARRPQYITTVWGYGYRLEADK